MSEENVAVVRRAFDAYTRGDIDEVLRLCADDILVTQAPEVPGVAPQQSGRGKQSGVEVEADFTFVFAIRDEQIVEWRIFVRESEGLAAAGLGG